MWPTITDVLNSSEFQALARECCIVQNHCIQRQQQCHHSGEALYEMHLQEPAYHPMVECCTVCPHSIPKLQHGHRFEEELYDMHLQKPEYMIVRGLKAECCIVQIYCSHKPEHGIQSLWRSTT